MKLLIVDDHEIVRRGIKDLLAEHFVGAVFGEAGNAAEALRLASGDSWDAVILDVNLPGRSGLEILAELKQSQPRRPVLVLSMFAESEYAVRVLRAGASGYLTKQSASDELPGALAKILAGGRYVTATLAEQLAADIGRDATAQPHESLSRREFQIMALIATGKSVKTIAEELFLNEKTVFTYRARLLEKLALHNDVEIARYALGHGLVE